MRREATLLACALGVAALIVSGCSPSGGGRSSGKKDASSSDTSADTGATTGDTGGTTDTGGTGDTGPGDTTGDTGPGDTTGDTTGDTGPGDTTGVDTGGGGGCNDVLQCALGCGQDQACAQACVTSADPAAGADFQAYVECQVGCPGPNAGTIDVFCMAKNCFDLFTDCEGGDNSLGCGGVLQCAGGCGQDGQCQVACLAKATSAAALLTLEQLNNCLLGECPGGDSACIQAAAGGACAELVQACQTAAKPGN